MGLWEWLKRAFSPPVVASSAPPPDDPPRVPSEVPRSKPRSASRVWPAALGAVQATPAGALLSAIPNADLWIHGVPCRAECVVTFHPNGQLSSAVLARAHSLDGESFSAGSQVLLGDDGRLHGWRAVLESERVFTVRGAGDGVNCALTLSAGTTVFVDRAKLRTATLTAPAALDGFDLPAGTELIFGDSGALSHAYLPEPWTLQGVRWSPDAPVIFEFGHLREGYPEGDGELDGVPYLAGEIVRFNDARRMVRCYLREERLLSGVPCGAGTRVYLDGDGGLLEGTLARDATLDGIPVAEGSVVALSGGVVVSITPREEVTVDGVPCAAGQRIERDERGRLRRATLACAREVRGFAAPAGSVLERDASGADALLIMTDGRDEQGREMPGAWAALWDASGALRMTLPSTQHSTPDAIALRKQVTVEGLRIAAGTTLRLGPDGSLREAVLARDERVQGLPCAGQTRVRFDAQGRLRALTLSEDTEIHGVPCARGRRRDAVLNDVEVVYAEHVRLHPDGSVDFATLARDVEVDGVPLAGSHTVGRHESGALQIGTLARALPLPDGRIAAAATLFGRFDDGTPSALTLAAAHGAHAEGTELRYASPGVLLRAAPGVVPLGEPSPVTDVG